MSIKASEISDLNQGAPSRNSSQRREARNVGHGGERQPTAFVRIHGLADARLRRKCWSSSATPSGLALNLEQDSVGGRRGSGDYKHISEGILPSRLPAEFLEVPVGPRTSGAASSDALGNPHRRQGPCECQAESRRSERGGAGRDFSARACRNRSQEPGSKPSTPWCRSGAAQRELNHRATGRPARRRWPSTPSSIRRARAFKCVYVAGSDRSRARSRNVVRQARRATAAMGHTVVVAASASGARGDAVPSRPTAAAPWASTSWTTAKTR